MDTKKYWEKFYKEKKAPTKQTKFAEFVETYFIEVLKEKNLKLIDLGAGNGRDSKYFLDSSFLSFSMGIDISYENKYVVKDSFKNHGIDYFNIVYSRFFLHSILNNEIVDILKSTKKYFVAEFRLKGDKPIIYKNHYRNLIDLSWFVKQLEISGFEILFLKTGKNMAKYKNENPYVCRVVAKKICLKK